MPNYDKDPRVCWQDNVYTATLAPGVVYQIMNTKTFGWCVFAGAGFNPHLAQDGAGNLGHGYSSAEAAIHAVIGRPRR